MVHSPPPSLVCSPPLELSLPRLFDVTFDVLCSVFTFIFFIGVHALYILLFVFFSPLGFFFSTPLLLFFWWRFEHALFSFSRSDSCFQHISTQLGAKAKRQSSCFHTLPFWIYSSLASLLVKAMNNKTTCSPHCDIVIFVISHTVHSTRWTDIYTEPCRQHLLGHDWPFAVRIPSLASVPAASGWLPCLTRRQNGTASAWSRRTPYFTCNL